jgi:DNA-binding NtrC family response regulator
LTQNQSILLIDNDEKYVDILGYLFELEGFNVSIAYSGEDAKKFYNQTNYPLIITDYGLSDTKGDEIAKTIRSLNPQSYIALNTGFKGAINPVKLGIFDVVFEKNMSPQVLVKSVISLFEKRIETHVLLNDFVLGSKQEETLSNEAQNKVSESAQSLINKETNQKPSPEKLVEEVKKLNASKSSKRAKIKKVK